MKNTMKMGRRWREKREKREKEKLKEKIRFKCFWDFWIPTAVTTAYLNKV